MLLIVGTKSTEIKRGKFSGAICPKCREVAEFDYFVNSKYTFITLIPLFPVGKEAVVVCNECDEIIDINDLHDTTVEKLAAENNDLKNPIWTYFGSFVLVLAIIYGIYSYFKSNDETEKFVQNPSVNDVYAIKDAKGFYYTFRIDSLSNDSIYATENDYQVDLPYNIDEINLPENYTKSKISYSKKELKNLYQEDYISSIIRK